MKNSILTIATFLTISFSALAAQPSAAYVSSMQETISLYDSVKKLADYQDIANQFERIAAAEKKEWLPNYYAGLTYVYMSFARGLEDDARDAYLKIATKHMEAAEALSPNNVEIVVLEGYIKMSKVSVSPMLRGPLMSGGVSSLFAKAVKMDPKNPRANLMNGRWKIGMAGFFGSSTEEACAMVNTSIALFESEDQEGITPHWGLGQAQAVSKNCGK